MTMTILTTLGALITALITGAVVAPGQETAVRAEQTRRAMSQTSSFGPGR